MASYKCTAMGFEGRTSSKTSCMAAWRARSIKRSISLRPGTARAQIAADTDVEDVSLTGAE